MKNMGKAIEMAQTQGHILGGDFGFEIPPKFCHSREKRNKY